MKDFFLAISFLTILPAGPSVAVEEKDLARSMAFFPAAGLVLGLLSALFQYLLLFLLPKSLVLWLVMGLLCVLTRALHLDGFADTIDGLACGGTRERVLEVMRDSRIGAFGVIGLILLIGGKYLALDRISDASLPYSLVAMVVMGRTSMVLICYHSAYARLEGGLAKPFTQHLGAREIFLSLASASVITLFFMGIKGMVALLGVVFFSFGYRLFFKKKLGGVTGDILGGGNELAELICLLFLVTFEHVPGRS